MIKQLCRYYNVNPGLSTRGNIILIFAPTRLDRQKLLLITFLAYCFQQVADTIGPIIA